MAGLGKLAGRELAALAAGLLRLTEAPGPTDEPADMLLADTGGVGERLQATSPEVDDAGRRTTRGGAGRRR